MKKTHIFLTLLAVALAAGVLFVSCDTPESNNVAAGGGGGDPTSITYTGYDDTYTYKLTINKDPNRAAFSPVDGDLYVLLILLITSNTQYAKSSGTVTLTTGGFTLSNNGDAIIVSINGSGISSFNNGTIKFDSGGTYKPADTKPGSPPSSGSGGSGGSVSGTYYSPEDEFFSGQITFSDPDFTMTGTIINPFDGTGPTPFKVTGTYTVSGNTITCTVVTSNLSVIPGLIEINPGDIQIYTILDDNCIKDEDGDNWIKKQ